MPLPCWFPGIKLKSALPLRWLSKLCLGFASQVRFFLTRVSSGNHDCKSNSALFHKQILSSLWRHQRKLTQHLFSTVCSRNVISICLLPNCVLQNSNHKLFLLFLQWECYTSAGKRHSVDLQKDKAAFALKPTADCSTACGLSELVTATTLAPARRSGNLLLSQGTNFGMSVPIQQLSLKISKTNVNPWLTNANPLQNKC